MIRLGRAGSLALALVALAAGVAATEPRRWVTVADKSEVSFAATFTLGNFTGRAEGISGVFRADPGNLRQTVTGSLQINPSMLKTGDDGRDRDMRKLLDVQRHPEIRFTVERVEASFPAVAERSDVLLTITGRMVIRGVERPSVFPGRVRLRNGGLWVRGETQIRMTEFGISPPSRMFFKVADTLLVGFDVQLTEEIKPGRLGLGQDVRGVSMK